MVGESAIEALLEDAIALHSHLLPSLDWPVAASTPRYRLSHSLGRVAFEHGSGALELAALAKYTSATGLLRLQYEALVRSLWLFDCATDAAIERLFPEEPTSPNERLPMLTEMLQALESSAPDALVQSLIEFRDSSWKPLSSYVHGGAHSVRWAETGFPDPLLRRVIEAVDGLLVLTALHFGSLSGDARNGELVVEWASDHLACLPDLHQDA